MNYLCLLLWVSGLLTGCGGATDGTVPAQGIVTYKGSPIANIAVVFTPTGKGQIAEGTTDASGNFELQTLKPGDGAMVGSYTVSFRHVSAEIPDMPGFTGGKEPEPSPIPEKYSDAKTSGKTATVDADSSKNVFKFDLE
jgi:hypothetical protein